MTQFEGLDEAQYAFQRMATDQQQARRSGVAEPGSHVCWFLGQVADPEAVVFSEWGAPREQSHLARSGSVLLVTADAFFIVEYSDVNNDLGTSGGLGKISVQSRRLSDVRSITWNEERLGDSSELMDAGAVSVTGEGFSIDLPYVALYSDGHEYFRKVRAAFRF